uniref:Uncharacterized protein n=1 Tax=Physcomitrium patens TaxID=3218 RepID=A0A2K1KER6_PHYPA|nr:hypothetical protein PHYPA_008644 [Physcomitrium patens]
MQIRASMNGLAINFLHNSKMNCRSYEPNRGRRWEVFSKFWIHYITRCRPTAGRVHLRPSG